MLTTAKLDSTLPGLYRAVPQVPGRVPSCGRGVRDGARQAGRGAGCGGCQRRSAAQRGVSGIRWLPVQNELLRRLSPLYPLSALPSCGDVRCVPTPFPATYCVGSRRSLSPGRNRSPPHGWHLCGRARDEPFRAATLGALLGAGCGLGEGRHAPVLSGREARSRFTPPSYLRNPTLLRESQIS